MARRETARILIVEDEAIIALDLAHTIETAGYIVTGPCYNAQSAIAAIEADPPDAAVLDVNLGKDQTSEPVARALDARRVPFFFLSGYTAEFLKIFEYFPSAPRCSKPCLPDKLIQEIQACLERAGSRAE